MKKSTDLFRPYPFRRFRLPFKSGPLFYFSYNARLFFYLLQSKAKYFLANDLDTLPAVYLAGKLRRIPVVYDSHEYFTEVPELVDRKMTRWIWERIEGFIFPKLKRIYTVNQSIATIYQEKYGVRVEVVRNVPIKKVNPPVEGELPPGFTQKPIVIYQGAINVGRGLEEMLHALPLLPDVHFLVAGDGDILPHLKEIIRELNLQNRVCLIGKVPFEKLSWYTRQASIGISIEQDIGLNYHYALPNKLFDYMHAGIPVLASGLPEIRHVVESAGFGMVIEKVNPQTIADAIRFMLSNPLQMAEWKEKAAQAAPVYTWEHEEQILMKFFPPLQ